MDPQQLLAVPAVRAWALASILVALKTLGSGIYTSRIRMQKGIFISPEDYAVMGLETKTGLDSEIERARRMHQNDLEAALPFALIGLVYALTGPSSLGTWLCFAGFPLARIAHGVTYARGLMPHRTVAWSIGFGITVWMGLTSLIALL